MSPVGHSIVGLSLATLALPNDRRRVWFFGGLLVFVAVASLPDWPLPSWGHDRYDISHSLFTNFLLIAFVFAGYRQSPTFRSCVPAICFWFGITAWLSHLLLDSLYNHGNGVAIYWPFSEARFSLALPWFENIDRSVSIWNERNLSVMYVELIAYAPVLLIALAIRFFINRRTTGHLGTASR